MTTTWWFPDNTVLCNFATVRRLGLLENVLAGKGRWVEAVAYEASRSAAYPGLQDLRSIEPGGWLGEPLEIDQTQAQRVNTIRQTVFGGSATDPLEHLGEAQTIYLLRNDSSFATSLWVTDDRAAFDYAKKNGILTRTTADIFRVAVADSVVSQDEAWRLLQQMVQMGRYVHQMISSVKEL